MKANKYITLLFASAALFAACEEGDALQGGTVTAEQKSEVAQENPAKLSSDMNALKDNLIQFGTISTSTSTNHLDFGFPALCLMFDQAGQDMVSENHGYNWLSNQLMLQDRVKTSSYNNFIWKLHFQHIKSANDILKTLVSDEEPQGQIANYIGQALASRAFDYLQLVQAYQFTYLGHEEELAVPIVTETMSEEEAMNNPLATVKDVYTQIMSDLDTAIPYLENNPVDGDKAQINAAVAYGLRARANMLMGEYANAATDAAKALELSGATPYSIEEVSVPSFNNVANSWIWGSIITTNNDVVQTGIINWPSHLCSMTGNGYTTGIGMNVVHKRINSALWERIPETDVRKGWWVDADMFSPNLEYAYGTGASAGIANAAVFATYTNVKFGPQDNIVFNTENSQDWPLMRAEEMLLIQAEALGRSAGVDAGKQVLEGFVKNYRDPAYTCTATDLDAFVDEVWFQRRVELWGEGFSLFDVLRLKKPIIRKGANFSGNVTFEDLPAESPIFIYSIPESEREANKGIDVSLLREDPVAPKAIM